MGIFDKIKQAANFITGGGAVVSVYPENQISSSDEPIKIFISCQIKDADIKMNKVYLEVRAIETVEAQDVDVVIDYDGDKRTVRENIRNSVETFKTEIHVADAATLKANQKYEWEVTLNLPQNIYGTYRGRNAFHLWQVFAGIDVSGNDPDSGWVEIEIE